MKFAAIIGLLPGLFLMSWAIYFLAIGAYEFFIRNDTVDYIILAVLVATLGSMITAAITLIFRGLVLDGQDHE